MEGNAPWIAHDGELIAIRIKIRVTFRDRPSGKQTTPDGGNVFHLKSNVEREGIQSGVIRYARCGVEIELQQHALIAGVGEKVTISGRAKLTGDGQVEILAIPRRSRDGIVVIQAKMLELHGGIVVETDAEDKAALRQGDGWAASVQGAARGMKITARSQLKRAGRVLMSSKNVLECSAGFRRH